MYEYIDTQSGLDQACAVWASAEFLALDTEFIRRDTFFPIAGLVQVGALGKLYLVDPLAITDWGGFAQLLENPELVKVLHSCSEDLEVFDRLCGAVPSPLLDTQIGAAMAGWGDGLSYQKLVLHSLDIHVEKGETRSDWLQRPLTDSQCHYAALDVEYLQQIYPRLRAQLIQQGRLHWWEEDCAGLIRQAKSPAPWSEYYRRNKSLWKLDGRERRALQLLCEWREGEARSRDIPRGRVIKDPACFELARRLPTSAGQMAAIKDIPPSAIRRYGDHLLALIEQAVDSAGDTWPEEGERPLSSGQNALLKQLREYCEKRAESLAIPVSVLARKRDFEDLIRGVAPQGLSGWRDSVIARDLLKVIEDIR